MLDLDEHRCGQDAVLPTTFQQARANGVIVIARLDRSQQRPGVEDQRNGSGS
jgi:hypothetical protein